MRVHKLICVTVSLLAAIALADTPSTQADQRKSEESAKPLKLSSLLSQTIVFLYEDTQPYEDAKVQGTGFIIGIPVPDLQNTFIPFIVTAKHVVAGRKAIAVRYSSSFGSKPVYKSYNLDQLRKSGDFFEHPDKGIDVSIFRTMSYMEAAMGTCRLSLSHRKILLISRTLMSWTG